MNFKFTYNKNDNIQWDISQSLIYITKSPNDEIFIFF